MIDVISILKTVMSKSPYFEYFYRNIGVVEFKFDDNKRIYFKEKEGKLILAKVVANYEEKADLIVELDKYELYKLNRKNKPLQNLKISTGENGSTLNSRIEKIIQIIFMPPKDNIYPMEDVLDLIYESLFKFIEPRVVWRSKKNQLYVLRYSNAYNDLDVYITYGFANPSLPSSELKLDEGEFLDMVMK